MPKKRAWSNPMINIVHVDRDRYINEEMELRAWLDTQKGPGVSLLDLFKLKLGRQTTTFVKGPECRLWIWENTPGYWRLYTNNQVGVDFEVIGPGAKEEDAWAAWNAFRKALGYPV